MTIPNRIIMKVCNVIMGEDPADKAFDALVEKALEDAGVGELIHQLSCLRDQIAADLYETGYTEADIREHLRSPDAILTKIGAAP